MVSMCIITFERKCNCQSSPLTEKSFHESGEISSKDVLLNH